jgi:hypothetical protein
MRVCSSPSHAWWRWFTVLPVLSCLSCSGSDGLNPVQGKLLYKNEPVGGALLTFHPQNATVNTVLPTALTEDDGTFTVATGSKEGAPAGEYVVTVICAQTVQQKEKRFSLGEKPETVDRFKGAYAREANSKIKVEIKGGNNELQPINLK